MRIARLDLLRYGHFTDTTLALAPATTDLHIVFGANEAGKSTARRAVGDFLFGFPARTPLDFLHSYGQLRIGARCEHAGGAVEAIRRKGRKDTLLDDNGDASNGLQAELERVLAGADADFFTRMFSLDHEGLRRGADALIAPEANADSAVLAAGSGLADALAEHTRLAGEADGLWAPNASQNRRYYQAEKRLKNADAAIREHEVTVGQWQRQRDAHEAARAHYRELAEARRSQTVQRQELERIRRVARPARRYREIEAELAELDNVARLPGDARSIYDTARDTNRQADLAIAELSDSLESLDARMAAIADDPALRAEAESIERLAESRGQIADDRTREAELDVRRRSLVDALAADRSELGWSDEQIAWPSAADLDAGRRLINDHARLAQALEHAKANRRDALQRDRQLEAERSAAGEPADTAAMEAWLAARASDRDLDAERRAAAAEIEHIDRDIARRLDALEPTVADTGRLAELDVPGRDRVDAFGEDMATAKDALARRQDELDRLADEYDRALASRERERAADTLPSAEELAALRERRDQCWTLVRRRYIDGEALDLVDQAGSVNLGHAAEQDPASALAQLIAESDRLADTRFERAEAIAARTEQDKALADREYVREQATARRDEARTTANALNSDWGALWQPAGLEPGSPAAMREWLVQRNELLARRGDRADAAARYADLDRRIAEYRSELIEHLAALGVEAPTLANETLAVLVQRARQRIDTEHRRRDNRQRIDHERTELQARLEAQLAGHDEAAADLEQWQSRWHDALGRLGLPADIDLKAAQTAIDTLDGARQRARELRELDGERDALIARRAGFESRLADVLGATGHNSAADEKAEQTSQRLSAALRETETQHVKLEDSRADRETARERIAEHEHNRDEANRQLDALATEAGVTDRDRLAQAIDASERARAFEAEGRKIAETLHQEGDGQAIDDLVAAVEASDLDALVVQIEEIDDHIADLNTRLETALEQRNAAQRAFEAIGGDNRAVIAAAERQDALADMQDAAERYLRIGTAASLLKWAGQRYSMDRQRPLIERGSALMNTLTGGSFERLAAEFDANDQLQIVGVRTDASRVWPTGMSEGTRDQLYLALRVAAIEDYLQRAEPLPVIADDLFINFDDERAMAGLDVLAGLAEQTQVLFFTHHQHLRDMAAERLGDRVRTHDL